MKNITEELSFRAAKEEDAELLIRLYNSAFLADQLRYGECPAYGRSVDRMRASVRAFPKLLIYLGEEPIGVLSARDEGDGNYYLGCLCVVPEFQNRGIGAYAVRRFIGERPGLRSLRLVTPSDKTENLYFYTKKLGFIEAGFEQDGNVRVTRLIYKAKQ